MPQRFALARIQYPDNEDVTKAMQSVVSMLQSLPSVLELVSKVPVKGGDVSGAAGQVAYDSNFLYLCVAPNTWRKIALAAL